MARYPVGTWQGKTIVPAGWIDSALTVRRHDVRRVRREGREYGYQLWRRDWKTQCGRSSGWHMAGNGGTMVVVVPDLHAVGVITTVNYGQPDMHQQTIRLLEDHLLAGLPCGNCREAR